MNDKIFCRFVHSDHLGSTTLITNETGGIVENAFYLPFGEVDSGGSKEKRLYEGKEFDGELTWEEQWLFR